MRAALTRRILSRLERHTPNWVRCAEAQILLNLASRSFGLPGRRIFHLPAPEALRAYAAYTVECMEKMEADPERLYEGAFQLGRIIRRLTGLREPCDIRRLVFYLYQNLCITMSGRLPGEIMVPRCYFSAFYSPEQCGLIPGGRRNHRGPVRGRAASFYGKAHRGLHPVQSRFSKRGMG